MVDDTTERKRVAEQLREAEKMEVIGRLAGASTGNLLRRLVGEQNQTVSTLDSNLGMVAADQAQLRQVLLNLVLNARDAMPEGGVITLHTRRKHVQGSSESVCLIVKDTGCGMNEETLSHLFEPFFTTKKPGYGTGLGLAMVQRIVDECGGTIKVESTPGRVTEVEVLLPAITPEETRQLPGLFSSRKATILLDDDHESARSSLQRVLRNSGFRVLTASTGERALKMFSDHFAEVDLLIADKMMPGMSGRELARTLCKQKPELRVMITSGLQEAHPGDGAFALIRKPFDSQAIAEKISGVLDSRRRMRC